MLPSKPTMGRLGKSCRDCVQAILAGDDRHAERHAETEDVTEQLALGDCAAHHDGDAKHGDEAGAKSGPRFSHTGPEMPGRPIARIADHVPRRSWIAMTHRIIKPANSPREMSIVQASG